ncbi:hypothetical protein [Variovorax atrisoli]|uniref:hypothetical protein n=1 Tax=Variovorax atrisoli TaxID=3394203 RepID=UPI00178E3E46|nr:hypothetical protein [Variovorax sp. BK613]MBB3643530.1 hypothetical protein [Variovorax sp. BK613]
MKRTTAFRRLAGRATLGACAVALASCGGGGGGGADPATAAAVAAAIAAAGSGSAVAPASSSPVPAPAPAPAPATDQPAGNLPPSPPAPALIQAKCAMDTSVQPSYEEQRLPNKLSSSDALSFSAQVLQASGFDKFGPDFASTLCSNGMAGASSYDQAVALLRTEGAKLWQAALDRVQGRKVQGTLPKSDDRMLYWARLMMTLALRQWKPDFPLTDDQRAALQNEFERASRGQYAIDFPEGPKYKRILVSGFDPFTLGTPGVDGNPNIRIGNPSGATILSLDGNTVTLADGSTAVIRTFILPVNYGPFIQGMQEDTLGPWFKPGTKRVDASISMSQGSGEFDLEHFNGRYHLAGIAGNDNVWPDCTDGGSFPASLDCDIHPPERWLGYASKPWVTNSPPQFIQSTLPFQQMIDAKTGAGIINWDDSSKPTTGWPVVRHDTYTTRICFKNAVGPFDQSCANKGGGGNYLSNASAYRNTLLRDVFKLQIPAGHIHTPVMTVFGDDSDGMISDATFEGYRDAIVAQARNLVFAVANSLATPSPM